MGKDSNVFLVFNRVSIPILPVKFVEFVDFELLYLSGLLVYCVIWWKVYLWGLITVIVLWK